MDYTTKHKKYTNKINMLMEGGGGTTSEPIPRLSLAEVKLSPHHNQCLFLMSLKIKSNQTLL